MELIEIYPDHFVNTRHIIDLYNNKEGFYIRVGEFLYKIPEENFNSIISKSVVL